MTKKTISKQKVQDDPDKECLNNCTNFRAKPMEGRRKLVKQNNICFKCRTWKKHVRKT